MEKLNDYFLNLLSNPTFSADDFTLVGLSIDNTSILDKNVYLNSDYIKSLDLFKTNGSFDESKFNNFYDYAKQGLIDLAKIKESDDLGKTWKAYRNDISMPETLRDNSPQFKIHKVANPLRLQEGFVNFNLKENPTQSIREIALTQKVFDTETGTWKDSPNDKGVLDFLGNAFFNPKVLATWDFDADANGNPTSDKSKIVYHKGDRKLNANGTYYYETLGDRPVYGKEVLSAFDTLTTDGSFMNKLDFLDSDDVEKNGFGSLMRAAALIVPAFIPGVNTWYIGTRVGLGALQILPVVGKMISGFTGINTDNSILSKAEVWDKALSFSLSDYVQGSLTDEGYTLQDSHLWSFETGLKLIADVFTQLAELRWMFEKSTSLFSGLSKDVITNKEAQTKWIEDYVSKHAETPSIKKILEGMSKGDDVFMRSKMQQAIEWSRGQKILEGKLKGALDLGSKLSMLYMTGITTASSYGEMKEQGASDIEAAFFTLGYTLAEYGLLNTDLGKWILPELKQERTHMKNVIAKTMEKVKLVTKESDVKTEIGKAKLYSKLFNLGKDAYHNNLGQGIANEVAGSIVSNMASEALEETSEELLLDLAKTVYNAGADLFGGDFKFKDAFTDVFDRYALSFIGGAVGGGIAGVLSGHHLQARMDRNMTQEKAARELVDYVLQGKGQELIETVNKMTFGSRDLDTNGNQVSDYSQSLDFGIKSNFAELVNNIQDILTVNGADLTRDSLMHQLSPKDVKYGMLASLATEESNSIVYYLNNYNELSTDLVKLSLELKRLETPTSDVSKKAEEDLKENKEKIQKLKEQIKAKKEELDKYKNGTMADEFMQDVVFELISKVSGAYINNFEQWAETEYKKPIDDFTPEELLAAKNKFKTVNPVRRDLIHAYRQVHVQNMEWLSKMMTDYDETYFKDKNETVNNLTEVLFGSREYINQNPNSAVPEAERLIGLYKNDINYFLRWFQQSILESLDKTQMKPFLDKLKQIIEIETSPLKLAKIETPIDSLEKLEALTDEQKNNLASVLDFYGYDEMITNPEYMKKVLTPVLDGEGKQELDDDGNPKFVETEELDINKLILEINNVRLKNEADKTEQFNMLFIDFLKDPNVKQAIIQRLKSAKYILPSVKTALDYFFNNGLSYTDESEMDGDDFKLVRLTEAEIKEYTDSYKNVPSSPVDVYISNIKRTLLSKGINIAPTINTLDDLIFKLARSKNLENFTIDEGIERQINDALTIIDFAVAGLDSAATIIQGDLSDAFGFNATINNIRQKRGDKKHKKLATIDADVAEGIKIDLNRYRQTLLYYKTLFNYNSNSVLNEHDKTYRVQSLNLYKKLLDFVSRVTIPKWDDLDKLKTSLENSTIKDVMDAISEGKADNTQEFKLKLTNARMAIDRAVHAFFVKNTGKSVNDLIKILNIDFKLGADPYTVLNANEESLCDKDFLWYLALQAAVDPDILMNEYQAVINSTFAPIIGQEEAIKKIVAFLVNPKVFKEFAEAWNENVIEKAKEEKLKNPTLEQLIDMKTAYTLVNVYRAIFTEGVPGSGKSSAVLDTVKNILKEFHPKALENVVIVSNSKENAKTLVLNLGFDPEKVQYFGIDEFRHKILNGYETPKVLKNGSLSYKDGDVYFDENRRIHRYQKAVLNLDSLDASLLIVDEATSLSEMDAAVLDDFMEAKNIYGIYAGDFDLLGTHGVVTEGEQSYSIGLVATNYITTHKLGQIIRGNNKYKSDNTITLKHNKTKFISSLMKSGKIGDIINFVYYLDDSGLYGDVVTKPDKITTASGSKLQLDEGTKNMIDKMINSLNEGEKINYIYDNPNSEMYIYLHEKYPEKINKISTNASQSLEGQYYIVDIELAENIEDSVGGILEALNYYEMLYTAMSRAKQGTLIYDRSEVIDKRIKTNRLNKLTKTIISQQSRESYASQRKGLILSAIPEGTPEKFEKLDWKVKKVESVDDGEDGGDDEDEGEAVNEPFEPNIKNDKNGELNMMIHTFNSHEIGGVIDKNGQLTLGEKSEDRVDNAHGIIKILSNFNLKDSAGNDLFTIDKDNKLSKEATDKIVEIIDEIRTLGTYGTSNDNIKSDIVTAFKNIFGVDIRDNISVRFIYKNSPKPDTLKTEGALNKFFKSALEKIRYLFSGETNSDNKQIQETPQHRTIGLEIFIGNKQLDVPIGVFTNPATIIKSKGFEELKAIYDEVRGNLINFQTRLKEERNKKSNIPHINEVLMLLEIYLWNIDHPKTKGLVIRFKKDFVLNSNGDKITGIQVPVGSRGEGYIDERYFYPGRPVTLEEYRREMPNRKISRVYEGINGDFTYNGKVYIKKGSPFVLMSDLHKNLTDRELYEKYIDEIVNNKPRTVTRVYVNFPKKDLNYFLWNLLEAFKKEGNVTKAKDIDYHIGNKLTSYRLLLFMMQEGSNFLSAYEEFMELTINDKKFGGDKENSKKYTLERINRIKQILNLLTQYENNLKDEEIEELEDNNGIQAKVKKKNTKRKLFLNFLDTEIKSLLTSHKDLFLLFIPEGSLNLNATDPGPAPIGNTNFTIRTALQYEFRRLLLGSNILENGSRHAFNITSPGTTTEIVRDGETYTYLEFLKKRIAALEADMKKNNWSGIITRSNLRRSSGITQSIGSSNYTIAEILTEDDGFISSESFEFSGKLPTSAIIMNVVPMLLEILEKSVTRYKDRDGKVVYETSSILSGRTNSEKEKIYRRNTGDYLEGRPPVQQTVEDTDTYKKLINAFSSEDLPENIKNIIKDYINENPEFSVENSDDIYNALFIIFTLPKFNNKFGILRKGNKFILGEVPDGSWVIKNTTNVIYFQTNDGNIRKIVFDNPNVSYPVEYSELIGLKFITSKEDILKKYKDYIIKNTRHKFDVGDIIIDPANGAEIRVDGISFDESDSKVYYNLTRISNNVQWLKEVNSGDELYNKKTPDNEKTPGQDIFDEVFGEGVVSFESVSEVLSGNSEKESLVLLIQQPVGSDFLINPMYVLYEAILEKVFDKNPDEYDEILDKYGYFIDSTEGNYPKSSEVKNKIKELLEKLNIDKNFTDDQYKKLFEIIGLMINKNYKLENEDKENLDECPLPLRKI